MNDLTAIDILVEPDQTALSHAAAANARLRDQYPEGFSLDARHTPHITLLQRYVRTSDLEAVFAAVNQLVAARDLSKLGFRANGIRHMPVASLPGIGLAAMVATPGPEVLDLQSTLIDAVSPFTGSGGTAAAFVTTRKEPAINSDTLTYVERYVPDHSGGKFIAHLTVGLAPIAYLTGMEAKPFETFEFHPAHIAVFRLGNNGTAQQMLKRWNIA